MRNKQDWARSAINSLDDALCPIGELRAMPIFLRDDARGRQLRLPAALPMVRAGAAMAGNDEDIDIRCAQGKGL